MQQQLELQDRWLGQCVYCGSPLANSDSIEAFSGPICREKYGPAALNRALDTDVDWTLYNTHIEQSGLSIKEIDNLERCHEILRCLSRGMNPDQATSALNAVAALGYVTTAALVGEALCVKGWDGASKKPAKVYLIERRIAAETQYVPQAIEAMRNIPGRYYRDKRNYFRADKQSAIALIDICRRWYPLADIDQQVFDLANSSSDKLESEKEVARAWLEGDYIVFDTPKDPEFFKPISAMDKSLRSFDWDTKRWKVHHTAADESLDRLLKIWPDAQVDGKIGERAKQLSKASDFATAITVSDEDRFELPAGTPFDYQCAGVKFLEIKGSGLLADEQGLGKTLQFLATLHRNKNKMPALVICPATVKLNWGREANRWVNDGHTVVAVWPKVCYSVDATGKRGKKWCSTQELSDNVPDICIVNYDIISRLQDTLTKIKWHSICLDESHFVKEYKSARSKAAKAIAKNVPNRVLLSGTPMPNRPKELWHQLNILDPKRYSRFTDFGVKYCAPEYTRWGMNWNGSSNLDELNKEILGTYMVRRRFHEVIDDVPDKLVTSQIIEPKDRREYDHAQNDFLSWAQEQGPEKLNGARKNEALTRLTALRHLAARCKLNDIALLAHDFLSSEGRQLVIFAHHRSVTKGLYDQLLSDGFKVGCILGGDSAMKRQEMIAEFKEGKLQAMVCSIQAAGTGTDGLQVAHDAWILERDWTPSAMRQTESRLHRLGQQNKVHITYFDMPNSIDSYMAQMLDNKKEVIDAIIDGIDPDENEETGMMEVVNGMLNNQ